MKSRIPWLATLAVAFLPSLVSGIGAPGPVLPLQARAVGRRQNDEVSSSVTTGKTTPPPSPTPTITPDPDVTSTVTVTVGGDGSTSTVTQTTTVLSTAVRTVLVTSTAYEFVTVTVSNVDIATETVFETVTETVTPAAAKRSVAPRITQGVASPLLVRAIEKRATVFVTRTVTVDGDVIMTTVLRTVTSGVTRSTTQVTTTTSNISSTTFLNAATTTTVTSTLTVQTTPVDTSTPTETGGLSDPATSDPPPSDGQEGQGDNNQPSGLSTGAKIGIGVGVGGAAMIILAVLGAIWYVRRRRNRLRPEDLAGAGGMSEVPVGPSVGASPEGYRGTAAAVPSAISGYKTSSNMGSSGMGGSTLGDDSLPAMPDHQRESMHPGTYEMPTGGYRNF